MKYSEMLRKARMRIESGTEIYICVAIAGEFGVHDSTHLREEISVRLDGCFSIRGWLAKNVLINRRFLSEKNLRIYRLRWIDSMIAEFEAEGN